MEMDRLTVKSQEALQEAQTKAIRFGHTEVDGEHLLLALLERPDDLAPRLLASIGVDVDAMRETVESELSRRPRTTRARAPPRGRCSSPSDWLGFSTPPSRRPSA